MSEDLVDEQSHYEISLTAGQAFIAFVLLLLSLAASFAFGLVIGRGQGDDRLVVRKEPAVITEAAAVPKKSPGEIVELGVSEFARAEQTTTDTTAAPAIVEGSATAAPDAAAAAPAETPAAAAAAEEPRPAARPVVFAQLLSSSDQKIAEALAARVINGGFPTAYVERVPSDKGMTFRVRVKFDSEAEAHAAEAKLREYSKEVWITK